VMVAGFVPAGGPGCLGGGIGQGGWAAADQLDLGPGTGSSLRFLQPVRARVAVRTATAIHMGFMASPAFAPCSAGADREL
jgi:hypothetical protein